MGNGLIVLPHPGPLPTERAGVRVDKNLSEASIFGRARLLTNRSNS